MNESLTWPEVVVCLAFIAFMIAMRWMSRRDK